MSFRPSNIESVLAIEAPSRDKDAAPSFVHLESGPYQQIKETLRNLYLSDERPWLVGFSGGKDSTMLVPLGVASLIFDVVLTIPVVEKAKTIDCIDKSGLILHASGKK